MRRFAHVAALLLSAFLPGCTNNMWWEYRDDPYLADMAGSGEQEALKNVNSVYMDTRQAALRILADQAYRHRVAGRIADAERLESIIIRRYHAEKESSVRACIVMICAPAVGRGATQMVYFLRERLAAGEYPGYAALALASLAPRGAFNDIAPLARHPAPEVRLQAATALTVLGDPRGYDAVCRVWRGMQPPAWPEKIEGESLEAIRDALALRCERIFGKAPN